MAIKLSCLNERDLRKSASQIRDILSLGVDLGNPLRLRRRCSFVVLRLCCLFSIQMLKRTMDARIDFVYVDVRVQLVVADIP